MFKMHKLIFVVILICLSLTIKVSANEYLVIINKSNQFTGNKADKKMLIKRIYLKSKTSWPNRITAKPVNQRSNTPEYQAFKSKILEMNDSEIQRYWARAKQKTGITPPPSIRNARNIVKLIANSKGAIGYIRNTNSEKLPETVEVLFDF